MRCILAEILRLGLADKDKRLPTMYPESYFVNRAKMRRRSRWRGYRALVLYGRVSRNISSGASSHSVEAGTRSLVIRLDVECLLVHLDSELAAPAPLIH